MRVLREIAVADRKVVVSEISVGDARALIKAIEETPPGDADPVTFMIFDDCTLKHVEAMSNLSKDEIDKMSPSELRKVVDAVMEVNADFFGMMERVRKIANGLVPSMSSATPASL